MSIRLSDFVNQTTDINTEEETPKAMRLGDYVSLQREPEAPIKDSLVDITPDQYEDWSSKGKIGFIEQLRRQDKTEMLPFNPEGAFKSMRLLMAVNRLRKNQDPMEQLEKDRDIVGNYLMKSEEERVRGYNVGGNVVRGVAELPAFMIEFLATSGLASVGKTAVRKGTSEIARKIVQSQVLKATTRTVGSVASATLRTAGMPHRITESFADRQLRNNFELTDKGMELAEEVKEKPRVSALKAFGDVLIENFSEVTGPTIGRAINPIIPKGLKEGLEKIFVRLKPNETVRKLWTKAGYNGFLEEMGEERVGNFLRALTGVESFGAEDPDSIFDRIVSSIPNAEELLVEALVLSVPGAANVATSQIVNAIQSRRKAAKVKDSPLHEITDQEADDIVQSGQEQEQPETEVVEPEAEGIKPTSEGVAAEQKPKIKEDPILNHFKGQLIEAGFDETDATEQASLIQTGINTLAKKAGVDPRSIFERYGVTIQRKEAPEGQPTIQKPVRYDNQGLPIRRSRSVVVTVPTPEGRQAKITHQMILDEADALFNEASELRSSSTTDVEKFVIGNGGLKAFVKDETGRVPESEEMRTVPIRFKNRNGLPADEMAQMAYDAGVISEPSSDLLREELKRLPIRGDVPVLADYYDEAQRNLEEYFSTFKGEPLEMAAQPALYQSSLFNFPSENIGDRYQRLRYQALSQGMNPIQASKWAKEQLKTQPLPTETGRKQGEFSIPGGVKVFGQGKQGEEDLFFQQEPPIQGQDTGAPTPQLPSGSQKSKIRRTAESLIAVPSDKSIAQHPDFVKLSFDVDQVINKYAKRDGVPVTTEFIQSLWAELHDNVNAAAKAKPEEKSAILEKYPDIRNEFRALTLKAYLMEDPNFYWERMVKDKYSKLQRPRSALEAEQQGTFDPENPDILFQDKETPRGSIEFKSGQTFISLFENADKSTFLHETGHFYLRLLGDLTKESTASQDLKTDASTILKWLGAESFESITVEQNEKFARGFEAYLMEGKAPTAELKSAFERFKEWLTEIYKSVKALNVQLSPEIRDVYARMLGAEAVAEKPGEKKREPMISGPEIVRGRMNRLVTEEESISRELEAVQGEKSALEEVGKKTDIAEAKIKRLTNKYNELDSELAELIKAREDDIKLGREEVQLTASEIRRIERSSKAAGRLIGKGQVKSAKEILDRRRAFIRGIRDQYQIDDADMKRLMRRDIRLMTNYEFKKFLDDIEAFAAQLQTKRDLKLSILSEINEKELKKVENLRQFLKFPTLDKMSVEQLNKFNQELESTQKGDEFLSVRKLETVKNTELAGIKTVREALEILAKRLNVPIQSLQNLDVTPMDKFRFDTALAEKNPFYKFLVDETNASMLEGEEKFLEYDREIDDLVKKARDSRKAGIVQKMIPTDDLVFKYMEAKAEEKPGIAKEMTDEEIDLANYMQARFAQFRDYLIQHGTLEKYRENYITHIRRGFLETWKEDGMIDAFKEVFTQYQEDAAVFKILEDDTENILPLEKFFAYAMHRTGEIKPSKNVARAFKNYTRAMLKKQALDKIVPALDIYAYSLSPKKMTPRGLQMNRRLIKFVREWINNKKGRMASLGGFLPQGGVVDVAMRAIDGFVTLLDLGLNVPVSVATTIGEQVTTFAGLGTANYAKGIVRMNTGKGKKIIDANRNLVGKSPWEELGNTASDIGDKLSQGLFILFNESYTTANKIHLLGSMTEDEWKSGKISTARKAEIKREIGRWRNVEGSRSIAGSTSLGKALTKYKSWAIPILRTVVSDLGTVSKMLAKGEVKQTIQSREFQELFRATMLTTMVVLSSKILGGDDAEDDSFLGKVLQKAYRESLTIMGAIDPTVYSNIRLTKFVSDLSAALKSIVLLEEYKTKEGYKGVSKLIQTLTPRAVKTIMPEQNEGRL